MKKFTVLCLVLVAILAMSSVGFAAPLRPFVEGDAHSLNIGVVGEVGPYASMYFEEGPKALTWNGSKGAASEKDAFFTVKSNTQISMAMEFEALRKDNYRIETEVWVIRGDFEGGQWVFHPGASPIGKERLRATAGVDGVKARTYYNQIQGVQEKLYKLTVKGTLRDIHEQAAGEYRTNILLTIAGFLPGYTQ